MKERFAHMRTDELDQALDALWNSPEDLHMIRRELLRRKTKGAARLRNEVEDLIARLESGDPQGGPSEGAGDEADLKGQISCLKIEVAKLRKLARLTDDKDYLYAQVGAHRSIPDYALEALREAHRIEFEAKARDAKDDRATLASKGYHGMLEEAFEEIARLRSEQRRSSGHNGKAPVS